MSRIPRAAAVVNRELVGKPAKRALSTAMNRRPHYRTVDGRARQGACASACAWFTTTNCLDNAVAFIEPRQAANVGTQLPINELATKESYLRVETPTNKRRNLRNINFACSSFSQTKNNKLSRRDYDVRHHKRLHSACRVDRQHEGLSRTGRSGSPRPYRRLFQVARPAPSKWSLAVFPRDRRGTQHFLLRPGRQRQQNARRQFCLTGLSQPVVASHYQVDRQRNDRTMWRA